MLSSTLSILVATDLSSLRLRESVMFDTLPKSSLDTVNLGNLLLWFRPIIRW